MARMKLDTKGGDFEKHPLGNHEGTIVKVEDRGEVDTAFGKKHKVMVKVESSTSMMEPNAEGEVRGHIITAWFSLSAHERAGLTKFRNWIAGRQLTPAELENFATDEDDTELTGKRIGYVVTPEANKKDPTDPYHNISAAWPLKDTSGVVTDAALTELTGKRIGYVVTPEANKKDPTDPYHNISPAWPPKDTSGAVTDAAVTELEQLEQKAGLSADQIPNLRHKYLNSGALIDATAQTANNYKAALQAFIAKLTGGDQDLPF